MHFLFSQELVERYGIDISQYYSFASLEPLLAQIAQEEPGCIPLFLTPAASISGPWATTNM